MTTNTGLETFLNTIRQSIEKETLVKITIGKVRLNSQDLKNVFIRPVIIGNNKMLSFVFRHATRDITKNFAPDESIEQISKLLESDFLQANVFGLQNDIQLMISKKGKIRQIVSKASNTVLQPFSHDIAKKRIIQPQGQIYLKELGVCGENGKVIPSMNSKFKQINKFIEIISNTLPEDLADAALKVVDMGSGKGYLTFALYDYLTNIRKTQSSIKGVEMREDLVDKCKLIAKNSGFENLEFEKNNIRDFSLTSTDMLIALHACDTATDEAIHKGILANAKYIIVAPCCHKQVRKAMNPGEQLSPVLKHGVYLERQAEILTDGIRGLILEKHAYKTVSMEFISTEHTPKNVMIVATKSAKHVDKAKITRQIEEIKKMFGIEYHHLELLLKDY